MEKKSLSQQTADRLYTMIVVEHRLSPGEKLPSEVELARELGVSRTTLREALHVLVSQKILEARRGRGTFVTDQAAQVNDYGFSHLDQVRGELKDLFELRAIFEPSAARLACLRATEEEMADIRNTFLSFGIPDAAPGLVWEQVLKTTQSDKKVDAGVIRFVLLKTIGQAYVDTAVTADEMRAGFDVIGGQA